MGANVRNGQASVAVIVVTWNGEDTARSCIQSLLDSDYAGFQVCLVDNGSSVDLAGLLSSEFPQIMGLRLDSNRGYAGGCNAGLEWGKDQGFDYALLLNDDTTVARSFVSELVAAGERHRRGAIIAPKVLFASKPDTIWSAGGVLRRPWFKADHVGLGMDSDAMNEPGEVEWASGCALLVPLSLIDGVGLMDERFFLYLEDVDWCLRMWKQGIPVRYEPEAQVWHAVSASVSGTDSRSVRYYSYRNHYLLAFKHSGPLGRMWFGAHFLITGAKIAFRSVFFSSYRGNAWYHARTRAMWDVLRRRFGRAPYEKEPAPAAEKRAVA